MSVDQSTNPKVSIIMNCLNGYHFLNKSVSSIFEQTYKDWEVIFWDNCSSDGSFDHPILSHSRIKKFQGKEMLTLGAARNMAIAQAKGDWISFLDVDDEWLPKKLEVQLNGLLGSSHILSYSGICEVDEQERFLRNVRPRWSSGCLLSEQLQQFEINLATAMIKRDCLTISGFEFDPEMQASEDYNLFMKILTAGTVKVEDAILARYQVHQGSLTYQKIDRWANERRKTLAELVEIAPKVLNWSSYTIAMRQADYYEACAHMKKRNYQAARQVLLPHTRGYIFFSFYLITYIPKVWHFIHVPKVKKLLTNIFRLVK